MAVLVWKNSNNSELELINEVDMEQPEVEILDFKMKGGNEITLGRNGKFKVVVMVTSTPDSFIIKLLKHKVTGF